ncbi:MAG: hypothetical protein WA172_17780 [Terriglobales bacterium]
MRVRSTILGSLLILSLMISTAAFAAPAPAAGGTTNTAAAADPLLQLLVSKGVINGDEAKSLVGTPAEQRAKLLELLRQKGILSATDYEALATPSASAQVDSNLVASTSPILPMGISQSSSQMMAEKKPAEPEEIPAVTPTRVLPINLPKQGGMVPDLRLGSGANMKIYGFYKSSAVSDTASSGGPTFGSQDWPLPLLLADTGPTSDPQFHIKARSFRIGANTEWVPKNSGFTITGKIEADFEGDYTDVNNRNISSDRSNEFCLRLAWMRLDHKLGDLPWFAEFGQDWNLVSSTLPSLFETTGLGVAMGSTYERDPMFRTGIQFHTGDLKIQPEFAIVMPIAGSSALTEDQRTRFGDRAGAESNQPGVESRIVFEFPLNKEWKHVAPAQIIFAGHHSRVNEIIPHAAQLPTSVTCTVLPCTIGPLFTSATTANIGFTTTTSIVGATNCTEASGTCTLEQIFGRGTQVGNAQNLWTAEIQVPTPWVTWVAKYYRGSDMRFFFAGQLNDVWSNLGSLFEVGNGVSESGRAITFGCSGGTTADEPTGTVNCQTTPVTSATLAPVAGGGGFTELSFPLSRIFNANPEGLNSGWVLHLQYGTDRAKYSDAQHGNHLGRTDLDTASLTYRLNKWVTFTQESSYIATFTANNHLADGAITKEYLPFAGQLTRQAHNWRNEFGPIFTF